MMAEKICYCFDLTDADIVADMQQNDGRSTIIERITKAKQASECRCVELHPEKR